MNDKPTHTVTITITGAYPHGQAQHASVSVAGDGDIDHMLDTFRAALVAGGFSPAVAARLDVKEDADG